MAVTVSFGALTTSTRTSCGVPASSWTLASCISEVDRTALPAAPGTSTSSMRECARIDCGTLSSEPLPDSSGAPPESRPPSVAPFPPSSIARSSAVFAWAEPGSLASRSNSCGVSGIAGSALTAETLATEVSASEIGDTHGPCSSSHLACALPCTAPSFSTESAGDGGGPKPVAVGSGWSGSAVWFTETPGTWIRLPAIAAPNGAASATERSCAR